MLNMKFMVTACNIKFIKTIKKIMLSAFFSSPFSYWVQWRLLYFILFFLLILKYKVRIFVARPISGLSKSIISALYSEDLYV